VLTGDAVLLDGEPTVVEQLLDDDGASEWELSEAGVLFANDRYGRLFEGISVIDWSRIEFVRRKR